MIASDLENHSPVYLFDQKSSRNEEQTQSTPAL